MSNKIKVVSLFTGIGAWEKAVSNLNIGYKLIHFAEFEDKPVTAYCAIHNEDESKNLGDITKININEVKNFDLLFYSPPCQAFSYSGKRMGFDDHRGVLFFDALKIIKAKKPKYALMENVKGLVGKKFEKEFKTMLEELEHAGYNNYHKVLNAKDYGIPQNRERVFIVSIRKDIDDGCFVFPEIQKGDLRLKDMLEDSVDEKYYLKDEKTQQLLREMPKDQFERVLNPKKIKRSTKFICVCEQRSDEGLRFFKDDTIGTIRSINSGGDKRVIEEKREMFIEKKYKEFYRKNGYMPKIFNPYNCAEIKDVSPTITSACGSTTTSSTVLVAEDETNRIYVATNLKGGMWDKVTEDIKRVYDIKGIAPTITTCQGGHRQPKILLRQKKRRIRKLTPKECFRLMGFTDEDYEKAKAALMNKYYNGADRTNSQMYKMAGNSIVVNVVEAILKELNLDGKRMTQEEDEIEKASSTENNHDNCTRKVYTCSEGTCDSGSKSELEKEKGE